MNCILGLKFLISFWNIFAIRVRLVGQFEAQGNSKMCYWSEANYHYRSKSQFEAQGYHHHSCLNTLELSIESYGNGVVVVKCTLIYSSYSLVGMGKKVAWICIDPRDCHSIQKGLPGCGVAWQSTELELSAEFIIQPTKGPGLCGGPSPSSKRMASKSPWAHKPHNHQ